MCFGKKTRGRYPWKDDGFSDEEFEKFIKIQKENIDALTAKTKRIIDETNKILEGI